MLITETTPEMAAEWKQIFEAHHSDLRPNRKTGSEVDKYFRGKYHCQTFDNGKFRKVVELNIKENEYARSKLPKGVLPNIRSYSIGDVLGGIDLSSGEFHVECENINKAVPIYEDLFVYRGLDEEDLKNYFLVAEYAKLTQI